MEKYDTSWNLVQSEKGNLPVDEDDAYFADVPDHDPFTLGHEMKVVSIDMEDDLYGVIVKVKEGRRVGSVLLCDVEVIDKEGPNYWPVREYVVWFANQ